MQTKTLVITWMDGPTATYTDVTTTDLNGTLHIFQYRQGSPAPVDEWHFPTVNIRAWGPRSWRPDTVDEHTGAGVA